MDYEKKYNEALKWMRELYPGLHGATREDAEHYFPELRESEDERVIRTLYYLVRDHDWVNGATKGEALTWLEKQKEQKPAESDVIKGGDFISDGKRVFLVLANVKERNLGETGSTFCEGHILGVDGVVYCNGDNFKKFKRATSNERAKFIHDLKVGVELKEQPTWSEEDKGILLSIKCVIDSVWHNFHYDCSKEELKEMWNWLDALWQRVEYPQPKQ